MGASQGADTGDFSIHALLAESDLSLAYPDMIICTFLSTLSLRRATQFDAGGFQFVCLFYPRSPCGERLKTYRKKQGLTLFYPRSPCGERQDVKYKRDQTIFFLSTLSLRRATAKVHKTVGHFCAYETHFMEIASSC